jgi:tetratricopeptide (TPR) repeat protein
MKKIKKFKKPKKQFIIAIDEEIDRKVNDALGMVEMGFIDKGAYIIEELISSYPHYQTVHFGMGVVHAFREQYDEAIRCFKKALDIFPYFTDAQFNLAVSYQKKLDVGNTIKAYQKVVEIGSADDDLVIQARCFLSDMAENIRKEHGIGLEVYLKGMVIFEKACEFMEEAKWEKAIDCYKDCLNIVKNHYQSYGNMGLCYAKLGEREQAILALDRALEINPGYEPALINRGMIASLKADEKIPDGHMEIINYSKEYAVKKKSYIAEIIDSFSKKMRRGE